MLISGFPVDVEAAAGDKFSPVPGKKQTTDEEKKSSMQPSSPVFTFSPTRSTSNLPSEIKTLQRLPQSGVAMPFNTGPMAVKLCWPTSPHPTLVYPRSPTLMPGTLIPQYPRLLGIQPMHVMQGSQMQVVITEAVSPSYFWIQRGGHHLTQLMERLRLCICSALYIK